MAKKKLDPKKLAALFADEGKPEVKIEVKKNDPTVTGKGVSKEVKKHLAAPPNKERIPAPEKEWPVAEPEPTPAEQKRQMVAAKAKALSKVLQLPPTENDQVLLGTTKLDPTVKVMRYHGEAGWASCLMWLEYREEEKLGRLLAKIHCIVQGPSADLDYEKMRPEALPHFAEIQGGYPIGPGIEAFRRHADLYGATKEVRLMLGMTGDAPPRTVLIQERDDNGKLLGEKRVAVANKNRDKGGPVSEDTNELYKRAARLLETREEDLRQKYGHLNPGMQSMNLRNRLRSKGFEV